MSGIASALPQPALPLWSLFPVCLPGKGHVTNPEGNADITVSLSHMCASLPPARPACIPASILSASPGAGPSPPPPPALAPSPTYFSVFLCHTFLCFLSLCRLSQRHSRARTRARARRRAHAHSSGNPFPPSLQQAFLPLSISFRSGALESSLF